MKILIVSDTLHAGGAETFCLRLARKLHETGVGADILSLNPDLENPELISQFPGVRVLRVQLPALRWIKRLDRILKLAGIDYSLQYDLSRRIIERKYMDRYDLFHTHLFPVDYLMAGIKKRHPGIHILSTLHGDYDEYEHAWQQGLPKKKLHWPAKRSLTQELVDRWVYISRNQHALFAEEYKVPAEKLVRIYNGYEPPAQVIRKTGQGHSEGLCFIMVARGIREKGWEHAISAFRNMPGAHRLVLVGEGAFLDEMKKQYGSDARIRFAGFHPNPAALIAEADVFIFPSVYKAESLPTVVIEALYCGLPVISTEIGEVAEMLTDPATGNIAGMLIGKEDEAAITGRLEAAMSRYISDPLLYRAHAALTAGAFQKFGMDACAARYVACYREILDNRRPGK